MSLLKTEVKAAAVNEVGNRLEDQFESSKVELGEAKGIRAGFDFAARKIEALSNALDADFKAEPSKLSEEEYRFGKKYYGVVQTHLTELLKSATEQAFRVQGKVAALEQVVKTVGTMLKVEEGKIAAFKSGNLVEEGMGLPGSAPGDASILPLRRPEGTHPGNPLAALRARGNEPEPTKLPKSGRRKKE